MPRNPQTDPEQERIGATLRDFRERNGLGVQELANQLGISYPYLSNIEAGRKRLTPGLATKAAAVLGVRRIALVRSDYVDQEAS